MSADLIVEGNCDEDFDDAVVELFFGGAGEEGDSSNESASTSRV